ncbi:MAG: FtsX-like permease family protein [Bacteroidales bacterium]|nr:FtsX-like permease family protein [Bacteroidales bacterium]
MNKLRTILTISGITIGIFSVIVVFTVVDSMKNQIESSIESLGSNIVFVQKWPWVFGEIDWWDYVKRPQPTMEDLKAIESKSSTVRHAAISVYSLSNVEADGVSTEETVIYGVSEKFNKVFPIEVENGRYFSLSEFNNGTPVCILGASIAEFLFKNKNPIDKQIKIFNKKVKVIGVLEKEGENPMSGSRDNDVIVTYNFLGKFINIRDEMDAGSQIVLTAHKNVPLEEMIYEVKGILRSAHALKPTAPDDFSINEPSLLEEGMSKFFGIFTIAGWIIGGFSLLVGGFGIANIMFVSVHERTGMIGIQKSLGAKNSFIMGQFLVEAISLSLIGGILGLLLVWILSLIASSVINFSFVLTWHNIAIGLFVSVLIGFIAGFIPAWRASHLDPVEAIRQN